MMTSTAVTGSHCSTQLVRRTRCSDDPSHPRDRYTLQYPASEEDEVFGVGAPDNYSGLLGMLHRQVGLPSRLFGYKILSHFKNS